MSKKCRSVSAKASLPSPSLIMHDLHAKRAVSRMWNNLFTAMDNERAENRSCIIALRFSDVKSQALAPIPSKT